MVGNCCLLAVPIVPDWCNGLAFGWRFVAKCCLSAEDASTMAYFVPVYLLERLDNGGSADSLEMKVKSGEL